MTACPTCGASVAGEPGTEVVCPACFAAFVIPLPVTHAFDVLLVDGTRHDNVNRWLLRERVYLNRYPPTARLSPAGRNDWAPIHEVDELRSLYALVGTEMPLATGTRRIAGWRRADENEAPKPVRRAAAETEHSVPRANEPAPKARPTPPTAKAPPPRPLRGAPVVSEGATVRVVAGGEEDIEIDMDDSEVPTEPPEAREITIAPPKRNYLPFILVALAAAGLGLALVLVLGSILLG